MPYTSCSSTVLTYKTALNIFRQLSACFGVLPHSDQQSAQVCWSECCKLVISNAGNEQYKGQEVLCLVESEVHDSPLLTVSWASWMHSTLSHYFSIVRLKYYLSSVPRSPMWSFLFTFCANSMSIFISHTHSTCHLKLIHHYLISQIIILQKCIMNLALYLYIWFFKSCANSWALSPNIALSTIFQNALFSNILSVYVLYCLQVYTSDFACGKYS